MRRARPSIHVTAIVLMLSSGCGFRSDRFYTLSTTTSATPLASHPLRVGLGPVVVPAYLDAPTLATRLGPNRLEYAYFDRWASPLAVQVPKVLGENLATSGAVSVIPYPWYASTELDVVVRVNVIAFESDAAGTAHLDAAWSLVEPRSGVVRHSDRTSVTEPAAGSARDAAVAALSRTLAELARRIGEALPPGRSPA